MTCFFKKDKLGAHIQEANDRLQMQAIDLGKGHAEEIDALNTKLASLTAQNANLFREHEQKMKDAQELYNKTIESKNREITELQVLGSKRISNNVQSESSCISFLGGLRKYRKPFISAIAFLKVRGCLFNTCIYMCACKRERERERKKERR